jgi:hypothetical protein
MTSVHFPESWRCHRVDKISIQIEMHRENQTGDRRIFHSDSEAYQVLLGHLIAKSPYSRVLRKYEQQIGRIAMQNPQISKALSRIYDGNTLTGTKRKSAHDTRQHDLFVIDCFLEFIYFATDEVIRELSGDKTTAV